MHLVLPPMVDGLGASLKRTSLYLRLGIAASVFGMLVAVGVMYFRFGVIEPVGVLYYSALHDSFVVVVSLTGFSLLALLGQGIERVALDFSAFFVTLAAVVPLSVSEKTLKVIGTADVSCPGGSPCFPESIRPVVDMSVTVFLAAWALKLAVSLMIGFIQRTLRENMPSLVLTALLLVAVGLSWGFARPLFLASANSIALAFSYIVLAGSAFVRMLKTTRRLRRVAYGAVSFVEAVVVIFTLGSRIFGGLDSALLAVFELFAFAFCGVFWILEAALNWPKQQNQFLGVTVAQTQIQRGQAAIKNLSESSPG
ncbi:hypothetical protein [Leifsonia xyli]|uniref:hypothetical protein n=1 Tax=Leifsonia xyli TaxID=1575 RepID=UPI00114D3124|nr:hypothetical protein [Leifsonia xyli]